MKKFLHRAPRILGILFILFISMFALDVFDTGLSARETIVALFMHLIPSWILIIVLILSRKHELVGAIFFTLGGLAYIGMEIRTGIMNPQQGIHPAWWLIIAGPALLTGALFFVNRMKKRK